MSDFAREIAAGMAVKIVYAVLALIVVAAVVGFAIGVLVR